MKTNTRFMVLAVIGLVAFFLFACGSSVSGSVSVPEPNPKAECTPKTFRGKGDDVVNVDSSKRSGCVKVTMTHDGSENFIVVPFDAQNNRMSSYANEIGKYEGTARWDGKTDMLEIDADGNWSIRVE